MLGSSLPFCWLHLSCRCGVSSTSSLVFNQWFSRSAIATRYRRWSCISGFQTLTCGTVCLTNSLRCSLNFLSFVNLKRFGFARHIQTSAARLVGYLIEIAVSNNMKINITVGIQAENESKAFHTIELWKTFLTLSRQTWFHHCCVLSHDLEVPRKYTFC